QITQKAWNDAAFFVDFDKDSPRAFRLGIFSDLTFWNPKNIAWEAWPIDSRPMISVAKPPFGRDQWTHVAFTVEGINAGEGKKGKAIFYLNGQSQGTYEAPLQFRWDRDQTAIMLGIDYIGDLDELKVFEGVLEPEQIQALAP
ncbi:MAG: LamG-like jellyroll fold domain-containing protein, partial [Pirellulaceae bacterium]